MKLFFTLYYSFTKLIIFILRIYNLFDSIDIARIYNVHDFIDDLKHIFKIAARGNGIVFTFCDTDIMDDIILEYLNNVLNLGEVCGYIK